MKYNIFRRRGKGTLVTSNSLVDDGQRVRKYLLAPGNIVWTTQQTVKQKDR